MQNFVVNLNECVRLSCITFVAERLGLFAVRLPSLPQGNGLGLWHNFVYFYPCLTRVVVLNLLKYIRIHADILKKNIYIHNDVLDEGYNVVSLK